MKRYFIFIALFALLVSCGKESEAPKTSNDSLLQKPLDPVVDTLPIKKPAPEVWYIDYRRMRTKEHIETLKRFTPIEVRDIYHDFKPLRTAKAGPESQEVQKFLTSKNINLKELKTILEEGDRLGWAVK